MQHVNHMHMVHAPAAVFALTEYTVAFVTGHVVHTPITRAKGNRLFKEGLVCLA